MHVNVMFEQRWQVLEMSAHWAESHLELFTLEHLYHGMRSMWVPVVIHTFSGWQFVRCIQQFFSSNQRYTSYSNINIIKICITVYSKHKRGIDFQYLANIITLNAPDMKNTYASILLINGVVLHFNTKFDMCICVIWMNLLYIYVSYA